MLDVGGETLYECGDRNAALNFASTRVHAKGFFGYVVVAHHKHIRNLVELGRTNALAELIVGLDDIDPEPRRPQCSDLRLGVFLVSGCHGQNAHLHGCEPCGNAPA